MYGRCATAANVLLQLERWLVSSQNVDTVACWKSKAMKLILSSTELLSILSRSAKVPLSVPAPTDNCSMSQCNLWIELENVNYFYICQGWL